MVDYIEETGLKTRDDRAGASPVPRSEERGASSFSVQTLIVSSTPRRVIAAGDSSSFARLVKATAGVTGLVWNEQEIAVLNEDPTRELVFRPEIYPTTAMFFERDDRRVSQEDPTRVWKGEFNPVRFTKPALVKFVRDHSTGDKSLLDSVRELKVSQRHDVSETMLDLDTDNVRRTEEEVETTNIPKRFILTMPLTEGIDAQLEFEAKIAKAENRYDRDPEDRGKKIELRVVNARQALKAAMETILERLPPGVPAYYGRTRIADGKGRD